MDIELKGCPWCGKVPKPPREIVEGKVWSMGCEGHQHRSAGAMSWVSAEDCIAKWNTRHGDAERSAELTTAWMAGVERERDRAARDAEDAARYRWLREKANYANRIAPQVCVVDCMKPYEFRMLTGDDVDAAIDAARAGERG